MTEWKKKQKANQMISDCFSGQKNLVTPDVLERGLIHPQRAYELASGVGMQLEGWQRGQVRKLYGITIVDETDGVISRNQELSKCFDRYNDARDYIKELTLKEFDEGGYYVA